MPGISKIRTSLGNLHTSKRSSPDCQSLDQNPVSGKTNHWTNVLETFEIIRVSEEPTAAARVYEHNQVQDCFTSMIPATGEVNPMAIWDPPWSMTLIKIPNAVDTGKPPLIRLTTGSMSEHSTQLRRRFESYSQTHRLFNQLESSGSIDDHRSRSLHTPWKSEFLLVVSLEYATVETNYVSGLVAYRALSWLVSCYSMPAISCCDHISKQAVSIRRTESRDKPNIRSRNRIHFSSPKAHPSTYTSNILWISRAKVYHTLNNTGWCKLGDSAP
ncbi:hypothetical protein PILCRDRAFT_794736 [Piloderma croceum F 1598]|uniref:Uncharacterized protein n=1 Tax=Piloderma croceum (strain F 1598) TaxID=765440 RepID=A0A0C3FE02_PILCF|nr:hypothetical protein PILCRDRAFT_794736 [Piloderma croceum F 1598]